MDVLIYVPNNLNDVIYIQNISIDIINMQNTFCPKKLRALRQTARGFFKLIRHFQ